MDLTTANTIATILFDIVSFLIKNGPALISDVENIVADLRLAWQAATSGTTLTPAQQAQIDTALDNANTALQAAIALATATPSV